MIDTSHPPAPPRANPQSLRSLVACLTMLEEEAIALDQRLAASFIGAAALALSDATKA